MRFCLIVLSLMLSAFDCHAAESRPPLEARLEVKVDLDGKLEAALHMDNHTARNLCLLPGWNLALALDANGEILGKQTDTPLLWPNFIDVVWDDDVAKHDGVLLVNDRFDVDFDPVGLKLTQEEAKRFKRATYRLELYDCAELATLGLKAKPKMTRELEVAPDFVKP